MEPMNNTFHENVSNHTASFKGLRGWEKAAFTTGLTLLIVITLIGNVLVVISFGTHRPLRTVMNYFIVSLAVSDILVAVISMPVWITFVLINMNFSILDGKLLKAWTCFDILTGVASILNLTAISVERCIHIVKPLAYRRYITKSNLLAVILSIWCISAGLSLVKGLLFNWKKPNYELIIFMFGFFLPLSVISICYITIYKAASAQRKKCKQQDFCRKKRTSLNKDMKAVKTIALVILGFFICWCPFFILNLYHGFCVCLIASHFITFAKWLHYANSALNPVIYACCNRDYRNGFKMAFLKQLTRRQTTTTLRSRRCTVTGSLRRPSAFSMNEHIPMFSKIMERIPSEGMTAL